MKELVGDKTLLTDWELSKHLLHNMWNYSDVSEAFTNHFRDAGVFETLQDILRDPTTRAAIDTDEVYRGYRWGSPVPRVAVLISGIYTHYIFRSVSLGTVNLVHP